MGHGSSFFGTEDPLEAGEQQTASIDKVTVSAGEVIEVRISEANGMKSLSEAGFGICPGGARHAGKQALLQAKIASLKTKMQEQDELPGEKLAEDNRKVRMALRQWFQQKKSFKTSQNTD